MRLLGKCPNCGADDSILSDPRESYKAMCGQCGEAWKDWLELTSSERRNGKQLIPVVIEVGQWEAGVTWPQSCELPCARLIVRTLNTALMVRFKLRACFAAEGGVEGWVMGEAIELRNFDGIIALWSEYRFDKNPACQKILKWYAEALRALLEEELVVDGKNFGRGAIAKLSPQDPLCEEKANSLLWFALRKKTGSKGFANAVLDRMKIKGGPDVAGLTDEQILQLYIPHPPPIRAVGSA